MRKFKAKSLPIKILGYAILTLGVFGTADYYVTSIIYSYPQNMGIVVGNSAMILLGLVTTAVASCLKNLEGRLDKIESISTKVDLNDRT